MDWLAVFGAITALIGVPGSLYAFVQIRRDIERDRDKKINTVADVKSIISSAGERVLIEFDDAKANVSGTFENAVMSFATTYPDARDARWLKRNPHGLIESNRFMLRHYALQSVSMIAILVIMWALVLLIFAFSPGRGSRFVDFLILACVLGGTGAFFGTWSYVTYRWAEWYRRRRDAAQAYADYLDSREIALSLEFTQSKRMFDIEQARGVRREVP